MTALAFAYGAGLLSTVNPCGFALLPAFLAVSVGQDRGAGQQGIMLRFLHGMTIGLALSAGFAAVFVTAGILLAVGLHSLITVVPWLAVGIGAVLALVGLALLSGRHIGLSIGSGTTRRVAGGSLRRVLLFGMGYAVASLSCTLAVFLAVIAQALATANVVRLAGVFAAYGAGAASVLTTLAVSAAVAEGVVSRAIRRVIPIAGRLGGILLILSGAYLVAYWLPALVHRGAVANDAVAAISRRPSAVLTAFVAAHQQVLGVVGAMLVVAAAGVVISARRTARPQMADDDACSQPLPDQTALEAGMHAHL